MAVRKLRIAQAAPVATYTTLDGALLAATHLVELDYAPADVAISPRDFRRVEPDRLATRLMRGVRRGIVSGTLTVVSIWLVATVGLRALVDTLAPLALIAAVAGAVLGVVAGFVQHRRARAWTWGIERSELVPSAFDVVVTDEPGRAGHDLARWWDPAAPPAQWRVSS